MQKYRGLIYNKEKQVYEWVFGMPSYGFETEEIEEIGTSYGDFYSIIPESLGEETEYKDRCGKQIYTGDIVTLEVDGKKREFVVEKAMVDREYRTLPGFEGEMVKVRLAGVVVFRWTDESGEIHQLLPCVDEKGICDTEHMQIVGNIHTKEKGGGVIESKSKK